VLRRAVAEAAVRSPSMQLTAEASVARATTEDRLVRKLRGDLDAIVLQALAKEPSQRYDGAKSMAEDLQRWFHGEPVKARSAPVIYRVGKFLARNRAAAWLAALSVIAVLLGVGMDHLMLSERVDLAPPWFAPPAHSVAVLPFANLSGDPAQDYFADGISEELINALSQIDALHVSARTSSFSFKGRDIDIGIIARTLNVAEILEGSIRRSGNTVRITVQLINTVNGFHLWSRNYDRDLSDILALQTDIATAVAQDMQGKL